jgi:hypothetical protein
MMDGFGESSHPIVRQGQMMVGFSKIGAQDQSTSECFNGLTQHPLLAEGSAHQFVRVGVPWVQPDRRPELAEGLIKTTSLEMRHALASVRLGRRWALRPGRRRDRDENDEKRQRETGEGSKGRGPVSVVVLPRRTAIFRSPKGVEHGSL